MSTATTTARRIAELERAEEWRDAFANMDRLFAWAVAVGTCDEQRADAIRTELRAFAPFETFVKGTWTPLDHSSEDTAAMHAMWAEMEAWEASQGALP